MSEQSKGPAGAATALAVALLAAGFAAIALSNSGDMVAQALGIWLIVGLAPLVVLVDAVRRSRGPSVTIAVVGFITWWPIAYVLWLLLRRRASRAVNAESHAGPQEIG